MTERSGDIAWRAAAIDRRAFADALAETTQSLVCVLDRDARILVFNEACERATGFARDQVLGQDACDFVIPPEQADAFRELLARVWENRQPSPQVGHWLTKDGERRLIAWSNRPVLDGDGNVEYLVTAGLDITERERTAAELRALEGDLEAKLAEVARLAQEQTALRRVATLVAAEAGQEAVFDAVSQQCARVLGAEAAAVFRFEPDGTATVVGRYDRQGIAAFQLGAAVPLNPYSAIGRVHATGEPARIDDYSGVPGEVAELMKRAGLHATVAAPISVAGGLWGAVAVTTPRDEPFPPESEARLRDFCELVSLAIASASAREELRASRARIVQAADEERRRLEHNLHDGAQQRLVSLALALRLARSEIEVDPAAGARKLDVALREIDGALEDLRELARGLHPAILSDRGLAPALESLASRGPLPVEIASVPDERYPEAIEATAYYVVAEALTNIARHADASTATLAARRDDGCLAVTVSDDGSGGADASGSGLLGLRDRVEAIGGSLSVTSPPGDGTTIEAVLPLDG